MKEIEIKVEGMVCNGCENRVQNALKTIKGIKDVNADHTTGIVKITSKKDIEREELKEKIEDIGFKLNED